MIETGNSHGASGWICTIDAPFEVALNGARLSDAPNKSVEALLLGLLHHAPVPSRRQDLARSLYPDRDDATRSNAFRQSLFRLRSWIGAEQLSETRDTVALADGRVHWTTGMTGTAQASGKDSLFARGYFPGLNHPWVEEFRRFHRQRLGTHDPQDPLFRWVDLIRDVAQSDVDQARALLANSGNFVYRLDLDLATELFAITKPRHRTDSHGWDHATAFAQKLADAMYYLPAMQALAEGARIARTIHDLVLLDRSLIKQAWLRVELGDVATAGRLLRRMDDDAKAANGLELLNLTGCYHWNAGNPDLAEATFRSGIERVESATVSHQLHFWVNYAYFAAEMDHSSSFELAANAGDEILSRLRVLRENVVFENAKAIHAAHHGRATDALERLAQLSTEDIGPGHAEGRTYLQEAAAMIESRLGLVRESRSRWLECERARLSKGLRLTPRLRAFRAQIFGS